ncbi:sensor histidine kinase [Aquirhabdus parva]|uniref:histidine kinase n=1 Tax=Aquirhabdus parva TaxID=2283318 RepID=A0A345P2W5_9GAMM|nr:HAMP domain-containing sensor histidine kinase [Aquirhabdus parva]AXI01624.1 sensor histidine kinase [Aquirhabdus parva]
MTTSAPRLAPEQDLRKYRSLRDYLVWWFFSLILIIGLLAAFGEYHATRKEALNMQDHNLELIAQLVADQQALTFPSMIAHGQLPSPPPPMDEPPQTDLSLKRKKHKESELQEAKIIIQPLVADGQPIQAHWIQVPKHLADGLSTLQSQGEDWRVFVRTLPTGQQFLVGQRTALRDELARYTSLRMMIPLVVLFPVLLLVITLVIRQAFKPITALALHTDQQKDGVPLPLNNQKIPREILPFVFSINNLLRRLSHSLNHQRRFIADAAHELRTPITALTLQTENLEHTALTPEGIERVRQLRQGLNRSQHLLEQLLSLAKQHSGYTGNIEYVSLTACLHEVLGDLMPLALQKNIDLGVVQQDDVAVHAALQDVQTILRNAISNAIRYTPEGGQVDIRIYGEEALAVIEVTDSGLGIPESDLLRVFDPFYRALGQNDAGSGLGLTIIQEIAQRYGGQVTLHNRPDQGGLRFEFRMVRA